MHHLDQDSPSLKKTGAGGRRRTFAISMAVAIVAASVGDIALKRGVLCASVPARLTLAGMMRTAPSWLINPWLAAGVLLMIVHFAGFMRALRLGPLSLVAPLRASTYIFTTLLAQYWLREVVSPIRWIGIAVILVGVTLVGSSAGDR